MDNEHCDSKGWTSIALVYMSSGAKTCPGDLRLISSPKHTCGGLTTPGCASAKFSTYDISYSQVYGRLKGYQVGHTNAFGPYAHDSGNADLVIDGVLISHGKTQKHIWLAYAVGFEKVPLSTINNGNTNSFCPCTDHRFNGIIPPFIGNDYYCSGVDSNPVEGTFYTTPLWTGEGCTPPNFCCSHSEMPWFL